MPCRWFVVLVFLSASLIGAGPRAEEVWTTIASEGEPFTLEATARVRYGAGERWVYKTVERTGGCSNAFFGSDPAYMVPKICQVEGVPVRAAARSVAALGPTVGPGDLAGLSLGLTSAVGGPGLPFTVGQALRRGEVPRGQVLRSDDASALQCVVKNRWQDGSAKFVILSGRVDLKAGEWRTIRLALGPAPAQEAPLPPAAARAALGTVSVAFAPFGTAAWTGVDWDRPLRTWISGPEMSSFVYRKPIGADAHLVAWLEVRVYRGGRAEVLAWIENGFLNVPGPTEKLGVATLTVAGTKRFAQPLNLLNHQRAALGDGATLTHWVGGDPSVTSAHSTVYLMATGLVPNYGGVTRQGSPLFGRLPVGYVPLAQASFSPDMPKPGYEPGIGLLPEWDVAYLTSGADPRTATAVLVNGLAAGRYGIHYRDETTQRILLFASHPDLVMNRTNAGVTHVGSSAKGRTTPPNTGAAPPVFDSPHHPSMGYMAYLLSGWDYFLEEAQFLATANYLKQNDTTRGQASGVFETTSGTNTVRGVAWAIRSLALAAVATPDDDTALRAQFVASLTENVNHYHRRYVLSPTNPLGLVQPYSNYNEGADPWTYAIWMDDFLTAAFGWVRELGVLAPGAQQRLDAFLAWKYRAVVGRLGSGVPGTFNYRFAAAYTMNYAPSAKADYAEGRGPWYADWGEAGMAMRIPVADGETSLQGQSGSDPLNMATGFWGNLLAALAYAVDHDAAGAAAAYERVTSASNYAAGAVRFDDVPVWSIRPRKANGPAR